MKNFFKIVSKISAALFSTRAAGLYILLFAAAIGIATFIENDYGTSSAQKVVFQAFWFEVLLVLFGISIIVNIVKFKMIKQKKWALILFHGAIILILIGAGITRYFGFEGIMHIRENDASNTFLSATNFLKFKVVKNDQTYEFNEEVLFATLGNNNWHESYLIDNDLIDVSIKKFIPNPTQKLVESINGIATLKVVVAGMNGREEYFIKKGEQNRFGNLFFNFNATTIPGAINILFKNDSLFFKADQPFTQMIMATQKKDTIYPSAEYQPLLLRSLYSDGSNNFVLPEFTKNGNATIESGNPKVSSSSQVALLAEISVNGKVQETYLYGQKGDPGRPQVLNFENLILSASYGTKEMEVPFTIKLKDFIMDKYPGTNSASSYASEVQLIDPTKNVTKDFRIFMNNILSYDGYRFFQSSFDQDEKGTYLSVNNDYWGTLITYAGYILLTIGMLLTFFSKKTRFYTILQKIKKLRADNTMLIFAMVCTLASTHSYAQISKEDLKVTHIVDINHANNFSKLVVQDFRGRMKPMHTLTREIVRKLAKKERLYGLSADQIVLSIFANNSEWYGVNLIKLGNHETISSKLGATSNYVSYKDFFDENGVYKLKDEVRDVYNLKPVDRGVYEKELLKIDEKVNILNMLFSGTLLKIVPNVNDSNNTWLSNHDSDHSHSETQNSVAAQFFSSYTTTLEDALHTNNYRNADQLIQELKDYQIKNGEAIMPSSAKINAEILLNNSQVFSRLALFYFLLGIAFLSFLFLSVFKPTKNLKLAYKILFSLVIIGFILHTIGLGLRWYISGRAPWSNGYESMIYIAWTSTLAGLIFTRKSFGGLAATMVLASILLLVSMLSFLDPEITPLVPVLKSYWLTIHVSLEAGSYGFLMLGAIIGIINLVLMLFLNETNKDRIIRIIKEMSYISELTLIGGLVMVSIGTYLGGVWANESWGRYWGWDAKETWALVTILVYAFILHMRIIPKLFGLFSYNFATIFGLATVIMTYYGVNYYLSGLHSYATGDPIPIPNWVYIVVACLFILSISAYFKKKKFDLK